MAATVSDPLSLSLQDADLHGYESFNRVRPLPLLPTIFLRGGLQRRSVFGRAGKLAVNASQSATDRPGETTGAEGGYRQPGVAADSGLKGLSLTSSDHLLLRDAAERK